VIRENQSRRDFTKVAQYEVLGNDAKRRVRSISIRDVSDFAGRKCAGFLAATCPTKQGAFEPSEIELAKSEAVTQESLGFCPISANLRGRDQDRCWRLEKIGPAGTSRK
jgi:hypothetical protein